MPTLLNQRGEVDRTSFMHEYRSCLAFFKRGKKLLVRTISMEKILIFLEGN
jgi:hypothetical protein